MRLRKGVIAEGKGGRPLIIIASLMISFMFVVPASLIFCGIGNIENSVIGADGKEIDIGDYTDMSEFADDVNAALEDHDQVIVIGSRTGIDMNAIGGMCFYIPSDKTLFWRAEYDHHYGIVLRGTEADGSGSFVVSDDHEDLVLPYMIVEDGISAEIYRDVRFFCSDSGVKNDGMLIINGDLTLDGTDCSIGARDRGVLTLNGNFTSYGDGCRIEARDRGMTTIEGSVTFSSDRSCILAENGGRVAITGGVTGNSNGNDILIIQIEGSGGELTAGAVTTSGRGIWVVDGGKATINGDLRAGGAYAIESAGEVLINGNVVAGNAGVQSGGGLIVIEGMLTADPDRYIGFMRGEIRSDFLLKGQYVRDGDYYVYDGSELINADAFVYVKIYGGTDGHKYFDISDGGLGVMLIVIIAVVAAAGAVCYFLVRKR